MAEKPVHKIAKERGLSSRDVMEALRDGGLTVTAAADLVDEAEVEKIMGPNENGAAPAAAPVSKKPAAPEPEPVVEEPEPEPVAEAPELEPEPEPVVEAPKAEAKPAPIKADAESAAPAAAEADPKAVAE